jgi:hypothetical protein
LMILLESQAMEIRVCLILTGGDAD